MFFLFFLLSLWIWVEPHIKLDGLMRHGCIEKRGAGEKTRRKKKAEGQKMQGK